MNKEPILILILSGYQSVSLITTLATVMGFEPTHAGKGTSMDDWYVREGEKIKKRKDYFDKRMAVKETKVSVGDWVLIKAPVGMGD